MESTTGVGFMAVFAVSGSVALLAFKMHKRLLSDFMKKIESELRNEKFEEEEEEEKKVRFAEDVVEPSSNKKEYRRRRVMKLERGDRNATMAEEEDCFTTMPLNRRALYKGIIEFRTVKGQDILQNCY